MRPRLLLALLLVSPAPLVAQAGLPAELPNAAVLEFEKYADIYGGRLVAAFDSIPAAKYGFRPMPVELSVGYIAQHLEHANYMLCERFGRLKHPTTAKDALPDTIKARWPKDTLVARLRASFDFCDEALDRVPDVESADVANALLGYETDLAEHYSQISVYMRLLGLVPPSALARVFPPVVTLPPSALAPYVGTYELTHGLDFVVTQRDGGLGPQHERCHERAALAGKSQRVLRERGGRRRDVPARCRRTRHRAHVPAVRTQPAGAQNSLRLLGGRRAIDAPPAILG